MAARKAVPQQAEQLDELVALFDVERRDQIEFVRGVIDEGGVDLGESFGRECHENLADARGSDVVLTDLGRTTIEAAAPHHVQSVRRNIFDQLTPKQVAELADIVTAILEHHEPRET